MESFLGFLILIDNACLSNWNNNNILLHSLISTSVYGLKCSRKMLWFYCKNWSSFSTIGRWKRKIKLFIFNLCWILLQFTTSIRVWPLNNQINYIQYTSLVDFPSSAGKHAAVFITDLPTLRIEARSLLSKIRNNIKPNAFCL